MEPKQFRRRVWAIVVLLAIMLTSLGSTLYDLQINNGDKFYAESQYKTAETETVEAGRGQILDRNGRPLVSDRAVYQVRLNPSLMGKAPERNAILLSLVQVSREHQVEWADTLPISRTEPFTFTTEDPYFTINQDKDGNEVKKLTQLGRLAVVMKWIKDPTEEPRDGRTRPGGGTRFSGQAEGLLFQLRRQRGAGPGGQALRPS